MTDRPPGNFCLENYQNSNIINVFPKLKVRDTLGYKLVAN